MSNLLRGALNLLGGSDVSAGADQGRLVGTRIDVGNQRFNVRSQIAQGGFATVYTCQETTTNAWYALKSQLANDSASALAVQKELQMLRDMNHPHIIKYVSSAKAPVQGSNAKEFLMVTELCSGGSVIDLLTAGNPLTLAQVCNIFHGACSAIAYLHSRPTPITHRDMKVENLLFSSRGFVKLCDFGSATTEEAQPADDWTAAQRTKLEEDCQMATTPMYRAPEILETYLGYPVGRQQDVWALGCVLFYLCHRSHPFEDSAKLRIVYAKYSIPEDDQRYTAFRPLVECTLKPDPRERPAAADLQQRIEALAVALDVRVDTAVPGIDTTTLTGGEQVGDATRAAERSAAPAAGAAASRAEEMQGGGAAAQSSTAFSHLRGQGLSMFRNLKEKSAAVMQTVQNTYGSKGPELVWLTSRIVIAPQMEGVPEALAAQAEETLRATLTATLRPYKMINLAQRRLRCQYPVAVMDASFPSDGPGGVAPSTDAVLSVLHAAGIYLRQQPAESFVVLLGSDVHCSLSALSLLVYHRVLPMSWCAIQLLQEKRSSPVLLPPSAHRLLDGLQRSVQPGFVQSITDSRLQLASLVVEHLPTFNNNRTGCRPLLMVYVGGTALWSPEPYETLRPYEGAGERRHAQFGLKKSPVTGDVCLVLAHTRMSSLTQRMTIIPMFSFGLHTALLDPSSTSSIELRKGDLDYSLADEQFIPEEIRVTLHFSRSPLSRPSSSSSLPSGARSLFDYPSDIVAPRHVVGSSTELAEIQAKFAATGNGGSSGERRAAAPRPERPPAPAAAAAPPPPQQQQQPSGGFFDSLSWGETAGAAAAAPAAPPAPPPHRAAAPPPVSERIESVRVELHPSETPILGGSTSPNNRSIAEEVDLLGINSSAPSHSAAAAAVGGSSRNHDLLFDPFDTASSTQAPSVPQTLDDLFGGPPLSSSSSSLLQQMQHVQQQSNGCDLDDLLGGFGGASTTTTTVKSGGGGDLFGDLLGGGASGSSMHRNASAPSFPAASATAQKKKPADPFDFDDFLSANLPPSSAAASATSTRSSTPSMQQQQRPNYSRSAFDSINPTGVPPKPKTTASTFDDLLQGQGFTAASAAGAAGGRTMGAMRRAEDIRDMTPEQIKIRDWTAGKERNIRALLASLSDVLWSDAPRWEQPSMAALLTANEVKKAFRKAAVVVHPDKQTGLPHAELAKAIMIELNDAWNAFEEAGSPSLT